MQTCQDRCKVEMQGSCLKSTKRSMTAAEQWGHPQAFPGQPLRCPPAEPALRERNLPRPLGSLCPWAGQTALLPSPTTCQVGWAARPGVCRKWAPLALRGQKHAAPRRPPPPAAHRAWCHLAVYRPTQNLYNQTAEALDQMMQTFITQNPTAEELHFLLSVRGRCAGRAPAGLGPRVSEEDGPEETRWTWLLSPAHKPAPCQGAGPEPRWAEPEPGL